MKKALILSTLLIFLSGCEQIVQESGSSEENEKESKEESSSYAPASMAGRTLEVDITSSSGSFASQGWININFFVNDFATNNTYSIVGYTGDKDKTVDHHDASSDKHGYKNSGYKSKEGYAKHTKQTITLSTGTYTYRVNLSDLQQGIVTAQDSKYGKVTFSFTYTQSGKGTYQAIDESGENSQSGKFGDSHSKKSGKEEKEHYDDDDDRGGNGDKRYK